MSRADFEAYAAFLERLTPETLEGFDRLLADDVHFRDPFNEVTGAERVKRIFRAMVDDLDDLSVEVDTIALAPTEGRHEVGFLHWRMRGRLVRMANKPFDVTGVSRVEIGEDGRVCSHVDYWDVAAGLYEMVPVLGPVLRWLKRRLGEH